MLNLIFSSRPAVVRVKFLDCLMSFDVNIERRYNMSLVLDLVRMYFDAELS